MKKFIQFFIVLTSFCFANAQYTENFETVTNNATSFISNGVSIDLSTANNRVLRFFNGITAGFPDYGWNGTANDNCYISNFRSNPYFTADFSIKTPTRFVKVSSFYLYLGDQNTNITAFPTENITLTGKLNGTTVFSVSVLANTFNTSMSFQNGYTFINLATFGGQDNSNAVINELQFTNPQSQTSGAVQFWAIDALTYTVQNPTISSSVYNAFSGVLTVTGDSFVATAGANNDINVNKLTISGQGGATYTLTSGNVEMSNTTTFDVTLNSADKTAINNLLNKNGTAAISGTTYNLNVAADWLNAATGFADATNAITVNNVLNLSDLVVNNFNLNAAFNSNTLTYNATVAAGIGAFTIAPTASFGNNAAVLISLNGAADVTVSSGATSGNFYFTPSVNTILIKVQSQDLSNTTTYTITTNALTGSVGAALDFEGTNDHATIANNSSLNVNQFTVETWLKWDSSSAVPVPFVCSKGYENMEIHITKSNKSVRFIPTSGIFLDTDANSLPENTWVHVACVYNPNASLAKIYINGVEMNTTKTGANPLTTAVTNNATAFFIGSRADLSFPFKGALDEFRIWNKALTQAEIVERYNCEIPTTASGLIANLHFNQGVAGLSNTAINAITDSSSFNNNATLTNFALTGSNSNFIGTGGVVSNTTCTNFLAAALDFDGTNDYASITSNNNFNINQFTIETWLKWDSSSSEVVPFITSKGFENMEIHINKTTKSIRFIPTTGVFLDTDANSLPENTWVHVACVYNPNASLAKIYINGIEMNATNAGANPLSFPVVNNAVPLYLGSRGVAVFPFKGAFDEFRVWNRALTQAEIQGRMNCEIPTTACGLITNLHFNQGIAGASNTAIATITDSSGFSNNAALVNFDLMGSTGNFIATGGVVSNTSCTNISIAAPTANATQTFCGNATIASLTATGTNLLWYANAIGGTALATTTTLTATTYYGSQTINGCESTRTAVAVTITPNTDNVTTISACGSYTWENNNQTYTTTGVYTGTTTNCVTEKLNLTIINAVPPTNFTVNGINYVVTGTNTVAVDVTPTASGAVILPATVSSICNTYNVTSIGDYTFVDCAGLTSIIIPNSITSIGFSAFQSCTSLASVTLPNSITSIAAGTFTFCTSLASIALPNSITSIGNYAFQNCLSLTSITIPNSVTSIGDSVFAGCSNLISVTVSWATPLNIDATSAFFSINPSATLIVPPGTVAAYDAANEWTDFFNIIENCSTVTYNETTVTACGSYTWASNGQTYTTTGVYTTPTFNCVAQKLNLTINAVPAVPTATATQTICVSGTIANLTATGTNLLWYANPTGGTALATTTTLTATTYYGSQTINGCESASRTAVAVTITPTTDNVTTISACGSYTWANNNQTYTTTGVYTGTTTNCVTEKLNLTIINAVPPTNFTVNGINYVVTGANTVAVAITPTASGAVILPATVSSICNTYTVTSIGDAAFVDCSNLTSITIPNSVTSIGFSAFNGCTGLTSISIPNSVTSIGEFAFIACTGLTSVTLPSSITSIGAGAFSDCTSLSSITIPNSVTSIGDNAFTNCYSLSSITIPNSVTNIGNTAFSNCINLTSITVSWAIPLAVNADVFDFFNLSAVTLIVPSGTVAIYDATPVWTNFFNIIENCSTVTYNETTVTACGSYTWASNGQTYTTSGVYTTPTLNCVAQKLNVTINAVPTPPTATSPQVSNTNTTLANLDVTGTNLIWYTAATGTTTLPSTTTVADGSTYYVSQNIAGCESTRTAITIRKISDATQTLCGTPTPSNLASTPTAGTTAQWFTAATGGIALPNTTTLASGTYYAAQGTIGATTTVASGLGNINNIALQADGKIIMAIANATSISRMNADGSGLTTIGSGLTEPRAVAVEADGKILVSDGGLIKRMNADGSNTVTLATGAGIITALAVQADGKILFADDFDLKRMNADGTGIVTLITVNALISGIAVQTDGKIVFVTLNSINNVRRINANASNIETFNGAVGVAIAVAVQSDGKILVTHNPLANIGESILTRFNADGTNPEVLLSFFYGSTIPGALAIQADGQILYALFGDGTLKRISNSNFSNRVPVTVNVIPQPAPPITATTQTFCESSTVANLTATGTDIKWYATAIGGTALDTTATLTAATTYYATQTVNGCESTRIPVLVEIGNLIVNAGADATFCLSTNSTLTATVPSNTNGIVANGFTGNYGLSNWTFTPATAQSSVDITSIPNTFTINGVMPDNTGLGLNFVQNNFSITAPEMVTISFDWVFNTNVFVNINGNQVFDQNSPMYKIGQGAATALNGFAFALGGSQSGTQTLTVPANSVFTILTNINGSGPVNSNQLGITTLKISNFKVRGTGSLTTSTWTATNGGSFSGDAAGLSITPLTTGTYTFAATSNNGCSASDSVDVVVNTTPLPTTNATQSFCVSGTIADLTATGTDIKWYDSATGGTALASTETLTTATYYVSQTVDGCESLRAAVNITVTVPTPPTATSPQVSNTNTTLANLDVTGTNLIWYTAATGTTTLPSTTTVADGSTYYVSQNIAGCESTRTAITIRKISDATQTVCGTPTPSNLASTPTAGTTAEWFTTATGGTALPNTTALASGTYYAAQGTNGATTTVASGLGFIHNIALQADGKIIMAIANATSLSRLNADGSGLTTIGNGLTNPRAVAVQADGKILVVDILVNDESVIKRMNADGSNTVTLATAANFIYALAVQADGKILFADSIGLKRMNADGTNTSILYAPNTNHINGIAVQTDGKIVFTRFSDLDNLYRMNANGTNLETFTVGSGNGRPQAVAVQSNGKIVVTLAPVDSETGGPVLTRFNADGGNTDVLLFIGGPSAARALAIQPDGQILYSNGALYRISNSNFSNRVPVTVTVIPQPALPIAATTQVFCESSTVANLTATGTDIKWYATAIGGAPLATTATLTAATTYYATQTINGCESTRIPVLVEIGNLTVNAGADATFCLSTNSTLTATTPSNTNGIVANGFTGTYALPNWIFTPATTQSNINTTMAPNSITINGGIDATNTISQNIFSITVPETVTITFDWMFNAISNQVNGTGDFVYSNSPMYKIGQNGATALNGFALALGGSQSGVQTITVPANEVFSIITNYNGAAAGTTTLKISNFKVRGAGSLTSANWTATNGGSFSGNAASLSITPLTSGTYTFAATSNNGCSASDSVDVVVNTTPLPTTTATQSFCVSGTVANLTATGTDIKWYATATGGTALASTETLTTATYYVSQTVDGCESLRFAVVVSVNPIPTAPTVTATQNICGSGTIANLTATGTNIKWYANATGGIALASSTALVNNTTYYVSQTTNGCESFRTEVLVQLTQSSDNVANVTNCSSYTWANNGQTYYVSGVYTGTTVNCITEKLNLTVNATIWSNNTWSDGLPNATKGAIFMNNFTATTDLSTCDVEVLGTAVVNIPTGFDLTAAGKVSVASTATLTFENNANLLQTSTATNTGNVNVKRTTPIQRLAYTMWSSPVANQNALAFSPLTVPTRFYTYAEANNTFVELATPSNTNFAVAKGYAIRAPNTFPASSTADFVGTFTGTPNNGDYSFTGSKVADGYNLIGNPYPSTILVDTFLTTNQNVNTLYFWDNSNLGTAGNRYATKNALTGTFSAVSTKTPTNFIAPGQGFYVQITSATNTNIVFNNAMRSSENTPVFFRNATSDKSLFKLNLLGTTNAFNQIAIGYVNGATNGIDNQIDAVPFAQSPTMVSSLINNVDYVIQGRPLPFANTDVVPLGFKTDVAGNYSFTTEAFEGVFANNQNVFVKDNLVGITHNVKQSPYQFSTNAGTFNSRFEIVYQSNLSIENPNFNDNSVFVFQKDGAIHVNSGAIEMKNVTIFDLRGRKIIEKININAIQTELNLNVEQQVLLVKITSHEGQIVTKKIVY